MLIRHLQFTALFCTLGIGLSGFTPAQTRSESDTFSPYEGCHLSEGLAMVESAPLADGVFSRTVETLTGSYTMTMTDGRRVMFAYPGEDFLANVKVETLPPRSYAESKRALVSNFEQVLASGDNSRNYKLKQ